METTISERPAATKFCQVTLVIEGIKAGCRNVSTRAYEVGRLAPLPKVEEQDQICFSDKATVIPEDVKTETVRLCSAAFDKVRQSGHFRRIGKVEAVLYYSCEDLGNGLVSNHMFAQWRQGL